ncbi:MAG: MFS transporter [Candidatus Gastranaerophilales bacterium]|nr:MFS transporter [Candidatus Gastranaerophilales bacterium]
MKKTMHKIFSSTFRALYSRNYRLFFIGQSISLIGTWVQNVAIMWLIYSLTNSAFLMGVVMFINSLPSIIFTPFAGVLVDRVNQYKTLILLQILFGVQYFIFALLTLSGHINIYYIILLGLGISTTMAFDMPLRQAFVIQLVDNKKDLNNAISLNSSSFNLARLIGPSIAGILIALFGEGICFLFNSLSYIPVIAALLLMKITTETHLSNLSDDFFTAFKSGIKYASEHKSIKNILIFLTIASFLGMSYPLLMPIFAKEILHGDAQTLGYLMSAAGVGALAASLQLAAKESVEGLSKWLYLGALILSFGMISLGFIHYLYLSLFLLFFVGYGMVVIMITSNTLLQHLVDNSKRGWIMGLYTIAFISTLPLSNLAAGTMAEKIGILNTFIVFGLAMLFTGLMFRSSFIPRKSR